LGLLASRIEAADHNQAPIKAGIMIRLAQKFNFGKVKISMPIARRDGSATSSQKVAEVVDKWRSLTQNC
jgi:hypothetical protein